MSTARTVRRKADPYPEEWPAVALAVKEAAGWRCVRCHHPTSPPNTLLGPSSRTLPCDRCTHGGDPKKPRILTVHHLDGVKQNLRWWNLTALCQVCHLSIQAKVLLDQMWLFEHSTWFRPYVAGYYVERVLGLGEFSRPQVERAMDEVLGVLQRANLSGADPMGDPAMPLVLGLFGV